MIPYDEFRRVFGGRQMSEDETAEYTRLKEVLDNAVQIPEEFPWQRWKELNQQRALSSLPEERPSREMLRSIKAGMEELKIIEERLRLWPLTDTNVDAQNELMNHYDRRRHQVENALTLLKMMAEDENTMFGAVKSELTVIAKVAEVKIIELTTLADICVGEEGQRKAKAELLTNVFQGAKSKRPAKDHRAVAVGVFRTAEWIGMTRALSNNEEWKAVLEREWKLDKIASRDKYQIMGHRNKLFVSVVLHAHELFSKNDSTIKRLPSNFG